MRVRFENSILPFHVTVKFLVFSLVCVSDILPFSLASGEDSKTVKSDDFFESNVRPLLSDHCFECHQRKADGDLRLDSRQSIIQGGATGPAIIPGQPEQSLLIQAISGAHTELEMPPENPLSKEQVETMRQWVADGAPWPLNSDAPLRVPDASGITAKEREFWSFQPLENQPIPKVLDRRWGQNPIDAFIGAEHDAKGISPVSNASPRTLIRRVTFDLIGLPPTPEEVAKFEAAYRTDKDAAYESLVGQLLASRHYGERWGQHWLDLVRYADTSGDASDFPVPDAYKYRNYVIDAFNEDLPYDEFVRQQIAGDLLEFHDDEQRWRQIIATGYIAISRRIGVNPPGQRHIMIEDTLDNLGKTFLGLTIGCARCHDHKFDPLPTEDYYALYGMFDSTIYPHPGCEAQPYRRDMVYRLGDEAADERLASHRKQLEPIKKQERVAFESYRDFQRMPINIPGRNRDTAWQEVLDLRTKYGEIAKTFPYLETAYAVSEGSPHDVKVHLQGNPKATSKQELVPRGWLQILGGQKLSHDSEQSGRLELANWIASDSNPLTARVMVNRIWQHHFGKGLVTTPSDFGVRGSPPSHPELLDFLAHYFVENDWSVKAMHRLILHSRTYQLSSKASERNIAIDPENLLLWRANRKRLDAEQIRDSILSFSDELDRSRGERQPFPHRLTYFFRQHEPFVADYETNRRSIYLVRQRIRKNKFLDLFDAADGNQHVGSRGEATTTLQALFFMNDPFVHEQARRIANVARQSGSSDIERVVWLYQTILGRLPKSNELERTRAYLKNDFDGTTGKDYHKDNRKDNRKNEVWTSLVRAILNSNEFAFLD